MTGPPIPPVPAGSNAIGSFQIGASQIGDIPPFDVWNTVISQYANSPILDQLILNMQAYLDQTANMDMFFDLIWNLDTAQGYGLDVWGRIVGVSRTIPVTLSNYFGMSQGSWTGFNQGPFFSGSLTTSNVSLVDSAFRSLILAKAWSNISDGSIASYNAMLRMLFPFRGNAWVSDGLNMTMAYNFSFPLTAVEQSIVTSGVLPHSTGVGVSYNFNVSNIISWDPLNSGTLTTLSNNNLTTTLGSDPGAGIQGSYANWFAQNGGKFGFEVTLTAKGATSGTCRVGFSADSQGLSFGSIGGTALGDNSSGIGVSFISGNIHFAGGTVGNIGTPSLSSSIMGLIDLNGQNAWFRLNGTAGTWNGNPAANPQFGIGGISLASMPGITTLKIFPAAAMALSGTTSLTANFGALSYSAPLPPGFKNF